MSHWIIITTWMKSWLDFIEPIVSKLAVIITVYNTEVKL